MRDPLPDLKSIPPRTEAEASVCIARNGGPRRLLVRFRCIDCGWMTESLDAMKVHQLDQANRHTRWQRFRRWLKLRGVTR